MMVDEEKLRHEGSFLYRLESVLSPKGGHIDIFGFNITLYDKSNFISLK